MDDDVSRSADRPERARVRRRIRASAQRVQATEADEAIARLRADTDRELDATDEAVIRALAASIARRLVAVPIGRLAQADDAAVARTAMDLFDRDSGDDATQARDGCPDSTAGSDA